MNFDTDTEAVAAAAEVMRRLVGALADPLDKTPRNATLRDRLDGLSDTAARVAILAAHFRLARFNGATIRQIAETCGLSERSVQRLRVELSRDLGIEIGFSHAVTPHSAKQWGKYEETRAANRAAVVTSGPTV
jgi:hypothetical protein